MIIPMECRVLRAARRRAADRHDRQGARAGSTPSLQIIGVLADHVRPAHAAQPRGAGDACSRRSATSCFDTVITRTVKFPDTAVAGEPITTFAPDQRAAPRPTASWPGRSSAAVTHAHRGADSGRRRASPAELDAAARRLLASGSASSRARSTCCCTLISKHQLDVTEVALHQVTDEFIAYIRGARADEWDLDEASEFLVVAATLLDLKAARLLPAGEVEDEEDLALLEARDLLFARLLQYRAYKEVVRPVRRARWPRPRKRFPRTVGPGAAVRRPAARGAASGSAPSSSRRWPRGRWRPSRCREVSIAHIHVQRVSVREQAAIIVDRLRRHRDHDLPRADRRLRHHAASSSAASWPCSSCTASRSSPSSRSRRWAT